MPLPRQMTHSRSPSDTPMSSRLWLWVKGLNKKRRLWEKKKDANLPQATLQHKKYDVYDTDFGGIREAFYTFHHRKAPGRASIYSMSNLVTTTTSSLGEYNSRSSSDTTSQMVLGDDFPEDDHPLAFREGATSSARSSLSQCGLSSIDATCDAPSTGQSQSMSMSAVYIEELLKKNLLEWSEDDVSDCLVCAGIGWSAISSFRRKHVDGPTLIGLEFPDLLDEHLVTSVSERLLLWAIILRVRRQLDPGCRWCGAAFCKEFSHSSLPTWNADVGARGHTYTPVLSSILSPNLHVDNEHNSTWSTGDGDAISTPASPEADEATDPTGVGSGFRSPPPSWNQSYQCSSPEQVRQFFHFQHLHDMEDTSKSRCPLRGPRSVMAQPCPDTPPVLGEASMMLPRTLKSPYLTEFPRLSIIPEIVEQFVETEPTCHWDVEPSPRQNTEAMRTLRSSTRVASTRLRSPWDGDTVKMDAFSIACNSSRMLHPTIVKVVGIVQSCMHRSLSVLRPRRLSRQKHRDVRQTARMGRRRLNNGRF